MVFEKKPILIAATGSARYGYASEDSDQDIMILSETGDRYINEAGTGTDYFFVSLETFRHYWAHPLRLADLAGDCTGNERLCIFLKEHTGDIIYAAPALTALFCLEYIAEGERSKYNSTIKTSLRTAMVLSHMAEEREDPFLLSDKEKEILLRARTGAVPVEERTEIYRRTILPENIDRLMKMPDHPTIKNDLFRIIEEVTPC